MIEVGKIHIGFRRTVIEDGRMTIYPYQITVLTGESGSGKTSLLNVLGLLDDRSTYEYVFSGRHIEKKDYSEVKRESISYVFQDYNAIDDLSVKDNFRAMFNIAGVRYSKKRMEELLEEVDIDFSKVNQKCRSLSGGEKQRLAVALALVKNPKLLLLDEPTANLDEENTARVVEILNRLKDKGIMIVIASHHPQIYEAEHVYRIENEKLIEESRTEERREGREEEEERKRFNPFSYALVHIGSHPILYGVMLLALSWALYSLSVQFVTMKPVSDYLDNGASDLANDEIFILNESLVLMDEGRGRYHPYGIKFSQEDIDRIRGIEHVEEVYPYHKVFVNDNPSDIEGNLLKNDNSYLDEVSCNGKTVNTADTFVEVLAVSTCISEDKEKSCIMVDKNVDNGVFIPSDLAEIFEIEELDHTEITFHMPIIMGYNINSGYTVNKKGEISEEVETDPYNLLVMEKSYEIKGIYEQAVSSYHYYDDYGGLVLFIDYREMDRLYEDVMNDEEILGNFNSYLERTLLDGTVSYFGTRSSGYIVKVDDYKNVSDVTESIQQIGDYIQIKTQSTALSEINSIKNQTYMTVMMQPIITIYILSILAVLLFIYTLNRRKKEISFIQAHGVRIIHLSPVIEMLYTFLCTVPIVFMCVTIHYGIGNTEYHYSLGTLVMNLGVIGLVLLICLGVDILYTRRLDIIKELRSK